HTEPHDHVFVEEVALVVESGFSVGFEDLEENAGLGEGALAELAFDETEHFVGTGPDALHAREVLYEEVLEQLDLCDVELLTQWQPIVLCKYREEGAGGLRVHLFAFADDLAH